MWITRVSINNPVFATMVMIGITVLGIMGDAQTELGRYDQALATVQRMVDLRPDLASYSRVSYQRELHGDLPGAGDRGHPPGPAGWGTGRVRRRVQRLSAAPGVHQQRRWPGRRRPPPRGRAGRRPCPPA